MSDELRSKVKYLSIQVFKELQSNHVVPNFSSLQRVFELPSLLVARCFPLNVQHISTIGTNSRDMMFLHNMSF